jgi:hypothetical protein
VIAVSFNGAQEDIGSIEALGIALDRYDRVAQFELWLSRVPLGPSICMLRNGERAFLMYLRFPEDSGFVSAGGLAAEDQVEYTLSNGQIDAYPRSWCIPVEQCYKALAYFFVNEGLQPEWVAWHES